ncbi:MAG TPA: GNAT family N-acetyltransferase [Clostridia bacterium]|nr:GNAT family N-acetyltransferase [Clostridia bacterium]
MIEIIKVKNDREMELVHDIRREVFIMEQGVPEELEMDEFDKDAIHVLAYVSGEPAGCGRLLLHGKDAKMGRVAVKKSMRRTGIGNGICRLLMTLAAERGVQKIHINAQLTAVDFYTQLGFEKIGDNFMEAGIEHVRMEKAL